MSINTSVKKILVIKLKHIGDVLLTVPAIKGLHELYPDAEITAFVNAGTEEMLVGLPYIKDVILYDRAIKRRGFVPRVCAEYGIIKKIRKNKFDLVVEFSGGDRGALCAFLSGASVRCGYMKNSQGMVLRDKYFTYAVPPDHSLHTVDYHMQLVHILGQTAGDTDLEIAVGDKDRCCANDILTSSGIDKDSKYVVMHPTSRWLFKCWKSDRFAEVADYIYTRYGVSVVVTSAPIEKEITIAHDVTHQMKTKPVDLSGKLSLKQLAAVIQGAELFLGIDSAPMHIAQAVSTPVLVLFGPSGVHNWGPRNPSDTVIYRRWECVPCGKDGCNSTKKSRCLDDISVDEVKKAIDKYFIG